MVILSATVLPLYSLRNPLHKDFFFWVMSVFVSTDDFIINFLLVLSIAFCEFLTKKSYFARFLWIQIQTNGLQKLELI